jgi:Ribbon-helix-helix protein, copG family
MATQTTITLDETLAARVATLASEAGQTVEEFVEQLLRGLVDGDVHIEDGLPVFRMPPGTPPLTVEEVDRLLHGDA